MTAQELANLRRDVRTALEIDGHSRREIARLADVSEPTVGNLIQRGKLKHGPHERTARAIRGALNILRDQSTPREVQYIEEMVDRINARAEEHKRELEQIARDIHVTLLNLKAA